MYFSINKIWYYFMNKWTIVQNIKLFAQFGNCRIFCKRLFGFTELRYNYFVPFTVLKGFTRTEQIVLSLKQKIIIF